MGVNGLWSLIEPSGTMVPLQSLEGKVLAVDVSIWLHQVVKGFQDKQGGALINSHLLGLFYRLCKLLYFRVKPIFVFDGCMPQLKRETIARRQMQRSKVRSEADRIHALLLQSLAKEKAVHQALGDNATGLLLKSSKYVRQQKSADDLFKLPDTPEGKKPTNPSAEEYDQSDVSEVYFSDSGEEYSTDRTEDSSFDDSNPFRNMNLQNINVKSKQFKALSADVRHEILLDIKETRKQSSCGRLHELPDKSDDFSSLQMKRLLKRRAIQESIEEVQKEMGVCSLTYSELQKVFTEQGIVETSLISKGCKRICSDENTKYLLVSDFKKHLLTSNKEPDVDEPSDEKPCSSQDVVEATAEAETLEDDQYNAEMQLAIALSLQQQTEDSGSDKKRELNQNPRKKLQNATGPARAYLLEYEDLSAEEQISYHNKDQTPSTENADNKISMYESNSKLINDNEIEFISTSESDSDLEIVSDASAIKRNMDRNRGVEIFIETTKPLMLQDDIFADLFNEITDAEEHRSTKDLLLPNTESNSIAIPNRSTIKGDKGIEATKVGGVCEAPKEKTSAEKVDEKFKPKEKKYGEGNILPLLKNEFETLSPSEGDSNPAALPIDISKYRKALSPKGNLEQNTTESARACVLEYEDLSEDEQLSYHNKDHSQEAKPSAENTDKRISESNSELINGNEIDLISTSESDSDLEIVSDGNVEKITDTQEQKSTRAKINQSNSLEITNSSKKDDKQIILHDKMNTTPPTISIEADREGGVGEVSKEKPSVDVVNLKSEEKKCGEGDIIPLLKNYIETPDSNPEVSLECIQKHSGSNSPTVNLDEGIPTQPEDVFNKTNIVKGKETTLDQGTVTKAEMESNQVLNKKETINILTNLASSLSEENQKLHYERNRQDRMALSITERMNYECQDLLRLFGIPYIVAPMEAEAQCAFLDAMHITNGTITDDSDIWLFGGRTVYKNFFSQNKQVLKFCAENVEKVFNCDRSKLIELACLVGSDYTAGIHGIGAVTAMEILSRFSSKTSSEPSLATNSKIISTLATFRDWWKTNKAPVKQSRKLTHLSLFKKLKNIELHEGFPNVAVIEAYLSPKVDDNTDSFTWGHPNVESIREFARKNFGWTLSKTDEILMPVIRRINEKHSQTSIKNYFSVTKTPTRKQIKLSRRVKMAVDNMSDKAEEKAIKLKRPALKKRESQQTNKKTKKPKQTAVESK